MTSVLLPAPFSPSKAWKRFAETDYLEVIGKLVHFSAKATNSNTPACGIRVGVRDRRDLPRALSAVERLLVLSPTDVRILRERADLYEKLGGTSAAAADLTRVLELEPGARDAAALRARVARLRGAPRLLN